MPPVTQMIQHSRFAQLTRSIYGLWCTQVSVFRSVSRCYHVSATCHEARPWSGAEDEQLLKLRLANANHTVPEIAKKLGTRSVAAINYRIWTKAHSTNPELRKRAFRSTAKLYLPWTEAGTRRLLTLRAEGKGFEDIQKEDFPGRTVQALQMKFSRLAKKALEQHENIRARRQIRFTKLEETTLCELPTQNLTLEQISVLMSRPKNTITSKLKELGRPYPISRQYSPRRNWTKTELDAIKHFVQTHNPKQQVAWSYEAIRGLVPGRAYSSIREKILKCCKELGISSPDKHKRTRSWTPAEDEEVLRLIAAKSHETCALTYRAVAQKLNRTRSAISTRAWRLRNPDKNVRR